MSVSPPAEDIPVPDGVSGQQATEKATYSYAQAFGGEDSDLSDLSDRDEDNEITGPRRAFPTAYDDEEDVDRPADIQSVDSDDDDEDRDDAYAPEPGKLPKIKKSQTVDMDLDVDDDDGERRRKKKKRKADKPARDAAEPDAEPELDEATSELRCLFRPYY
jgi:hypothetical protein